MPVKLFLVARGSRADVDAEGFGNVTRVDFIHHSYHSHTVVIDNKLYLKIFVSPASRLCCPAGVGGNIILFYAKKKKRDWKALLIRPACIVIRIRINSPMRTESVQRSWEESSYDGFRVVYGWFSGEPRHTGSKRDYHKGRTLNPELPLYRTALRVQVILEIHRTPLHQVPFHRILLYLRM